MGADLHRPANIVRGEVCFNLPEHSTQQGDSFCNSFLRLLVVLHRAALIECPKTDLRVDLKRPVLTLRCDHIIHLLDLWRDAPCLLAQPPRCLLPID